MLIQSLQKKATVAWSPLPDKPSLLAVGTIDGYVDQSFNTSSCLEIYEYSPSRSPAPLTLLGSVFSPDGFVKVAWGRHSTLPCGVIVGAHSSGALSIWDPAVIIAGSPAPDDGPSGSSPALKSFVKKHSRSIQALVCLFLFLIDFLWISY